MKITDYMPKLYDNNLEMNSLLDSEEKEFENNLKPSIINSFKDNFIEVATEKGIENYEKLFNIIPDKSTQDIETRRQIIKNRLLSQIPFTERFLVSQLNLIIGENQWEYTLDYANYTLDIYITVPGRTWYNELYNLLDRIIPCNIDWQIHIYAATWQAVKENFETWQDVKDNNETWQDVMDGEWLNS